MRERPTITFTEEEATPPLAEGAFGFSFRLVSGDVEDGEPRVALHAAWRVPARPARLYGGRVNSAIEIVAVDLVSGHAYARAAEPDHVVPFLPEAAAPLRGPVAASGQFSADLERHLGLPDATRAYAVFLWIDELVSHPQLCEVRFDSSGAGDGLAGFVRGPGARLGSGDVTLAASRAGRSTQLEGAAYLSSRCGTPPAITALALGERTRHLGWKAGFAADDAEEWRFSFPLAPLLDRRGRPERVHVLAVAEGAVSELVTVEV